MSESSGAENLSEKPGSPDSDAESLELKLPGESSSPKELALWAGVLVLLCTVKLWVTGVAAAYMELPTCEAVMLQVPGAASVAVLPETVQTLLVVEA